MRNSSHIYPSWSPTVCFRFRYYPYHIRQTPLCPDTVPSDGESNPGAERDWTVLDTQLALHRPSRLPTSESELDVDVEEEVLEVHRLQRTPQQLQPPVTRPVHLEKHLLDLTPPYSHSL